MAADNDPARRFTEPAKFLPVAFVVAIIVGLYVIYTTLHLGPRLADNDSHSRALVETITFNIVTGLLLICYIRCIVVHPGGIPDKEEDPTWGYVPQPSTRNPNGPMSFKEVKETGDRRHCKWCVKYKPDRCHHCRVCRMCILKMDHHCPWIYNCVGFRNHKFFFLLLFYSTIALHLITWSMLETVTTSLDQETPFMKMFLLLFGETLAGFLTLLMTGFFIFHIWLMLMAMTTIEFCEKYIKRSSYDTTLYDRGLCGNLRAVLGDSMWLWLFPVSPPSGTGLSFIAEESRLLGDRDLEPGRSIKRREGKPSKKRARSGRRRSAAGTGSAPSSEQSGEESMDSTSEPGYGDGADPMLARTAWKGGPSEQP